MQARKSYDIAIVGAGPAGLLAAGRAAMLGARTIVLEKMEKPARKLRITGKGRCNITNMRPFNEFVQEITPNSRFLNRAFGVFFNRHIVEMLEGLGVTTVTERGQRVFPASGKAWDVAEGLVGWAKAQGAELHNHCPAATIAVEGNQVKGVVLENGATILAPCVIIATGGKSYPATGSTGDGYRLAEQLGHSVVELRPSLTGIETHPAFPQLNGLTLRNVGVSLHIDGQRAGEEFGEVAFTGYGVDGPAILRLSLRAIDAFRAGRRAQLSLDLKPALNADKLLARVEREADTNKGYRVSALLRKLLPAPLVAVFARHLRLSSQGSAAELTPGEKTALVSLLKNFGLEMRGYRAWNEAIVTAGGVSLSEIDSKTMESKFVGGLYFAGEVIDLSGNTGGYNLQIAFSTGWLAGQSAAGRLKGG